MALTNNIAGPMGTRLDISWVAMSSDFYVEFRSVIRGFHAYRSIWTPVLGEIAIDCASLLILISATKK